MNPISKLLKTVAVFWIAIGASLVVAGGTSYVNRTLIDSSKLPVIDAETFINYGTFGTGIVQTSGTNTLSGTYIPYRTLNTLSYTNRGIMEISPGFEFATFGTTGDPIPAKSFYNAAGALIAADGVTEELVSIRVKNTAGAAAFYPDWLRSEAYGNIVIQADNIRNAGTLAGGAGGEIRIEGKKVDLTSGIIDIPPRLFGARAETTDKLHVFPELGVYDIGWNIGAADISPSLRPVPVDVAGATVTNANVFITSGTPFTLTLSPRFPFARGNYGGILMTNATVFVHKWDDGFGSFETNVYYDIIFFRSADPNVTAQASFGRETSQGSTIPDRIANFFYSSYLSISARATNPITGNLETTLATVVDKTASAPTGTLLTSLANSDESETKDLYFTGGDAAAGTVLASNAPWDELLLFVYNDVAGNSYGIDNKATFKGTPYVASAGYLSYLQGSVSVPAAPDILTGGVTGDFPLSTLSLAGVPTGSPLAGANYTNFGGRVSISADKLDLGRARIRAQGPLVIDAKEYSPNSSSAVVDAALYSLNLARSQGTLLVTNLVHPTVSRLGGAYFMQAMNWKTTATFNTPSNSTISINIGFHLTFVDTTLSMSRPSIASDIKLQSTNVVVGDSISVAGSFSTTAEAFTLSPGAVLSYLPGTGLTDITDAQFPNLKSLTNFGSISSAGIVSFGTDSNKPLASLVNVGSITSGALELHATDLVNSGVLKTSQSYLNVVADNSFTTSGSINVPNDVYLSSPTVSLTGGSIAGTTVNLNATKSLVGTGGAVVANYGITVSSLPPVGDLSGTTLQLSPGDFETAELDWPGRDLGPTKAGFTNNLAVKSLILEGGQSSGITLTGNGTGSNAIYAGKLVVTQQALDSLGGPLPLITVPDGFRVYFGDAVTDSGASALDALLTSPTLAGKVIQVPGVSSTSPLVTLLDGDGNSITVPWALRNSPTIDSDGDGIPNLFDPAPFDPIVVSSTEIVGRPEKFAIRWTGAAGKTYQVEYSTDIGKKVWKSLTTVTNTSGNPAQMEVKDPIAANMPTKVYRVVYTP